MGDSGNSVLYKLLHDTIPRELPKLLLHVLCKVVTVLCCYLWCLQVNCYDYDNDGDHDLIGSFSTTVEELMNAAKAPVSLNFFKEYDSGFNSLAISPGRHRVITWNVKQLECRITSVWHHSTFGVRRRRRSRPGTLRRCRLAVKSAVPDRRYCPCCCVCCCLSIYCFSCHSFPFWF